MAVVEVIGNLIRELALSSDLQSTPTSDPSAATNTNTNPTTSDPTSQDPSQIQKQLTNFYDLLLSRTLDLSSYVRTKVLSVLSKLCDLPVKFPQQRLAVTRAAVGMLEDKAAGVRKGAVGLVVRLVVTHPYGLMHGGLLGLGEWEERYRGVKGELEKVEGGIGDVVVETGGEEEGGDTEKEDEDEDEDEETVEGSSSVDGSPKKSVYFH
jgi:condensin complex subunit 1